MKIDRDSDKGLRTNEKEFLSFLVCSIQCSTSNNIFHSVDFPEDDTKKKV